MRRVAELEAGPRESQQQQQQQQRCTKLQIKLDKSDPYASAHVTSRGSARDCAHECIDCLRRRDALEQTATSASCDLEKQGLQPRCFESMKVCV